MNLGQRLVSLTAASPFTGAGMSLVTALVALGILLFLRRMLPPENRDHGGVLKIFLAVGALLAFTRLGLLTVGVGRLAMGRLLTMLSTFFVAMGVIGTAVMGVFEILPSRANIRFPLLLRDLGGRLASQGRRDVSPSRGANQRASPRPRREDPPVVQSVVGSFFLRHDHRAALGRWVGGLGLHRHVGSAVGRAADGVAFLAVQVDVEAFALFVGTDA